jgi:speckle-type POZ protein
VFKLLLDFIYSDSISVQEVDDAEEEEIMWQQLLEAADRYDLPRLRLMCEQELCEYNNTTTVASILALAAQHHCRGLKEACLGFLNSPVNLQQVMALDGLEPLVSSCPSVLKDLIGKLALLKIDVNAGDSGAAALPPVIDVPEPDLHLHLSSLLHSEERTDVTFQVGGETFRAHRCVLAARPAVFRAELFGAMKDTASDVICIDDMEARVFKLLLTFVYTDSVPETNEEEKEVVEENDDDADVDVMWQQLLVAADRYGIKRLRLMCETKLGRYINANTVATILSLAEQHHCRRLKKECLDFLDFLAHLKQVMEVGGLDHLRSICPSVLIDLIAKLASL